MTINKQTITVNVTGNNATFDYDGTEHSAVGYTATLANEDELPNGVKITLKDGVTAEAKRTEAGTTNMGLTAASFNIESANYDVTIGKVVDGYVTITPFTDKVVVTITENSGAFIDRVNVAEHIDILHLCVGFRSRDFRRNYLAALGRFLKSLNRNFQSNQRLRFQNRVDFRFGGQRNVFCRSNAQHQRHQRRQQCQKPFLHLSHSFLSSIVSFAQNRSGPILFPILILFPP